MKSILALCVTCVFVGVSAGTSKYGLGDLGFWLVNFGGGLWAGWITAGAYPLVDR